MEYDLHSNVKQAVALDSQDITTDTTTVGNIIDTVNFDSLEYIIQSGTITDGAYALKLEQGDDSGLSDAADVPADEILGVLTGFVAADDDAAKRVGSIGKKRFQRLSIVSTSTTTGATKMSAVAVLGHPQSAPVAE
ncbi:MAG: hypothetical protein JKX85_04950 [Phycisphaeraceae bacterium]|nr:hypothetical protein [Phycisphaeraceae bacterium]